MNYLDILICIPMVWFAWKGFGKGLIIELASLISLALGIYIAIRFAHFTAIKLKDVLSISEDYLNLIAFIFTFVVVVAVVFLFAKLLEGALKAGNLSLLNKLSGMAFSMLKTALILSSLIYILNRIDSRQNIISPESRQKSLLFQPIEKIAPITYPFIQAGRWVEKADSIAQPINKIIGPSKQE